MLDDQGWFTWAEKHPGPMEKQYSQPNEVLGVIMHSMVGTLAGWYSRLFDMAMYFDAVLGVWRFTPNAAASVTGSVLLGGKLVQHFSIFSSVWANGARVPNTRFPAFEHESEYTNGHPDETFPFTPQQIATDIHIVRDIDEYKRRHGQPITWRRPTSHNDVDASLYEHNECVRWGATYTACPSKRARWQPIIAGVTAPPVQEEEMLHLVKTPFGTGFFVWLTDWSSKQYVSNVKVQARFQAAGKWPPNVEPLNAEELALFYLLPRGPDV